MPHCIFCLLFVFPVFVPGLPIFCVSCRDVPESRASGRWSEHTEVADNLQFCWQMQLHKIPYGIQAAPGKTFPADEYAASPWDFLIQLAMKCIEIGISCFRAMPLCFDKIGVIIQQKTAVYLFTLQPECALSWLIGGECWRYIQRYGLIFLLCFPGSG